MTPARLALYVRAGCHLCDEFLLDFSLDHAGWLDRLETVDVDAEIALATEFGLRVPVLTVDGRVACEGRYDRDKVVAALGL
jgi:ethanolamine ammonia-lyase small subunit